jgi:integrase
MGGTRSEKIARGVRIRNYPSGKRALEIQFQYQGMTCKEVIPYLNADRKGDHRYAINLKAEIESTIARQTFDYQTYFPNSPRAKRINCSTGQITIRELIEDWLIDVERTYPHSTFRCYKKSCYAHLIPQFGDINARELTPHNIRQWIRSRTCTLKSIRNDLTPLRAVLDQALNDDLIDFSPLDKIKVSKLVSRATASSGYQVNPFTSQEINAILDEASDYEMGFYNLLQFAFYTGLRTSELFGLQWRDVDWDAGTVSVQRAIVEREMKETKTQSSNRSVILLPSAMSALKRQKILSFVGGNFVFIRPEQKGHYFDYEHLERPWKIILKRAEIAYRNPYQTRHTYASQLLSGGENPLFVAKQMGHKTTEMIMRHYGRWVEQGDPSQQHVFTSTFGQGVEEAHVMYEISSYAA